MHDYITFIMIAACAVMGAGLFRVGLHLKSGSPVNTLRAWLFIAFGIVFGFSAVLILVFEAVKLSSAT